MGRKEALQRYKAWRELQELSLELALAGFQAQGLSRAQAWEKVRARWKRASADHQKASLRIARQLHAREKRIKSTAA